MVSEERYYLESNDTLNGIVDSENSQVYTEICDLVDLLNEQESEINRLKYILSIYERRMNE